MKVNKNRLVQLIKEELFYREFYRGDKVQITEADVVITGRVSKVAQDVGRVANEIDKIAKSSPEEFVQLAELLKQHEGFMNMVLGMGFQPPQ